VFLLAAFAAGCFSFSRKQRRLGVFCRKNTLKNTIEG
jgi:hypothetical protein